jgi:large subunit ribosomal protein L25
MKMKEVLLEARTREELGKNKVKKLRFTGEVPAIIYGKGQTTEHISVNQIQLKKIYHSARGINTIIKIILNKNEQKIEQDVLSHNIELDTLTHNIMHVDFIKISEKQKIKIQVPVQFIGIAPGAKKGGALIHSLTSLEIECLPNNIIDFIEVDLSKLEIGDAIRVSDLPENNKISIINDKDAVIALVKVSKAPEVAEESALATAEPALVGEEGEAKTEEKEPEKNEKK